MDDYSRKLCASEKCMSYAMHDELFCPSCIVNQLRAELKAYKDRADTIKMCDKHSEDHADGCPHCTIEAMDDQLQAVLGENKTTGDIY